MNVIDRQTHSKHNNIAKVIYKFVFKSSIPSYPLLARKGGHHPKMEKTRPSDQVVLFLDQHNPKPPSIESENHQNKPKHPLKVRTLNRLSFSKPKSRILEYNYNVPRNKVAISEEISDVIQPTYKLSSNDDDKEDDEDDCEWDEDETEEDGSEHGPKLHQKRKCKIKWRLMMEWILFLNILTCLVCSLTISSITNMHLLGLEIWKWCLMAMVTFSGRLVSGNYIYSFFHPSHYYLKFFNFFFFLPLISHILSHILLSFSIF